MFLLGTAIKLVLKFDKTTEKLIPINKIYSSGMLKKSMISTITPQLEAQTNKNDFAKISSQLHLK